MSVPKSGSSKEVVLRCGETPSIFEVTKTVLKTTQSFQRSHHLHHFQLSLVINAKNINSYLIEYIYKHIKSQKLFPPFFFLSENCFE